MITEETSLMEIAALVSQALQAAGIDAILSGGGAVTQYSENAYMSTDLDFVTYERHQAISPVMESLGFERASGQRHYEHKSTRYFVEFPPGPLSFGDTNVGSDEATMLSTPNGWIRIITPTQCVMDRIAWFVHGNDRQSHHQAILVAKHQEIDWSAIQAWAKSDGIDESVVEQIREESNSQTI